MTSPFPTLRDLQHFIAVAESASFARAAETCGLTQPAISRSVSRLEDILGVQLLERTTHYVRLTPFGETALAEARTILDQVAGLTHLAAQEAAPLSGPLRIGIIPTLCPYFLPYMLPALAAAHPDLRPSIVEAPTGTLVSSLTGREIDIALLALPVPTGALRVRPLFVEPFWFAGPRDHPLADRESIAETDLAGEPVLLLAEGHCFRDQALDVCRRTGTDPGGLPDVTATSIETLMQLVRNGTGTTLVPALSVPALSVPARGDATHDVTLRPVRGERTRRRIALVHRAADWRDRAFARLAGTLRDAAPNSHVTACPDPDEPAQTQPLNAPLTRSRQRTAEPGHSDPQRGTGGAT
jgi:LysR family hydrogen peroxide-inducible transcriptional activator